MKNTLPRRAFIKSTSVLTLGLGVARTASPARLGAGQPAMVLVEKGIARAPIVLAADAPEATARSASDLAEYIGRLSGAQPAITREAGSVSGPAIWVGLQPNAAGLFPGRDLGFRHHEETLLLCDGLNLLLAGRDRLVGGQQTECGTANAVYTFIQDWLGVRWLWPGSLGEDLVQRDTLTVSPFEHRYHPRFRQRSVLRRFSDPHVENWARFQRNYLDSFKPSGGHAFGDWHDKYYQDHPDYFALQPDGTRGTYPTAKHMKLCESNPRVWEQWLKNAEERLLADPTLNVVSAMPNDGHSSGICLCENCKAWDQPNGRPWVYSYKDGRRVEHVAMTDRYVKFWNILARKLKERFPGREIYLTALAYGPSTPGPVVEALEDNIVIGYVGKFPLICDVDPYASPYPRQGRVHQKEEFKDWAAKAPMIMFRPNLWYWGGGLWGFPEMSLTNTREDFRFVADHGCRGFFADTVRGHWSTQGPMYYLMAQMSWNPFLDARALMQDYYARGYGRAAGEIEDYWNLLEQTYHRHASAKDFNPRPMHSAGMVNALPDYYNAAFFAGARDLLQQARSRVAGEPEKFRQRIDFLEAGLVLTELLVQAIQAMTRVRETGGRDNAAIGQANAIWETINRHCRASLPYAVNLELNPESRFRAAVRDSLGPPDPAFLEALRARGVPARPKKGGPDPTDDLS